MRPSLAAGLLKEDLNMKTNATLDAEKRSGNYMRLPIFWPVVAERPSWVEIRQTLQTATPERRQTAKHDREVLQYANRILRPVLPEPLRTNGIY
jgi:hypothetical protein